MRGRPSTPQLFPHFGVKGDVIYVKSRMYICTIYWTEGCTYSTFMDVCMYLASEVVKF